MGLDATTLKFGSTADQLGLEQVSLKIGVRLISSKLRGALTPSLHKIARLAYTQNNKTSIVSIHPFFMKSLKIFGCRQ